MSSALGLCPSPWVIVVPWPPLSSQAKLQELQALEEVLGDPELTGEKFQQWKERNQELYSEGLGGWGVVQAEGHSQVLSSDSREQSSHPLPSDPEEQSCLCPLTPESNLRPPDL